MSTETAMLRVSRCRLTRGRSNGQFDHRANSFISRTARASNAPLRLGQLYKFRIFGYRRNFVTVNKSVSVMILGFFYFIISNFVAPRTAFGKPCWGDAPLRVTRKRA